MSHQTATDRFILNSVLCKSLELLLISLYVSSKEADFDYFFYADNFVNIIRYYTYTYWILSLPYPPVLQHLPPLQAASSPLPPPPLHPALLSSQQSPHYELSDVVSERPVSWRAPLSPSLSFLSSLYLSPPSWIQQTKEAKQLKCYLLRHHREPRALQVLVPAACKGFSIHSHPKQLHHKLSVLFVLIFILFFDLLQFVL